MEKLTRRDFLTAAAAGAALIPVIGTLVSKVAYASPEAEKMGAGVKYKDKADAAYKKANGGKIVDKVEPKDQKCSNCKFMQKDNKCPMVANQVVAPEGWCMVWAKK